MGKQLYEKKEEKNFTKTLQKREGGKREREREGESLRNEREGRERERESNRKSSIACSDVVKLEIKCVRNSANTLDSRSLPLMN